MKKKKSETSIVGSASPTMKVVAYVRVSTEQQAAEGNSLEAQKNQLEHYAAFRGLTVVAYEIDAGVSASSLDRPGLNRALDHLRRGEADGLLVVKLDRLTRSVRDLCDLVDRFFRDRFSLISASEAVDTGSASGRLVLNILVTVSQWEREAATERTAAVMQHLKASGRYTGGWPPFGWRADEEGALVPNDDELRIVARAKELRAAGKSLRAIAGVLGTNPRTGNDFDAKAVSRMIEDVQIGNTASPVALDLVMRRTRP